MAEMGRVRVEPCAKRIRAVLGDELVADSFSALLVWEVPYYPTYYFPASDVRTELLTPTGESKRSPSRGEATQYLVKAGDSAGAAYSFHNSNMPELSDHYVFVWNTMDRWYEEDEEVFVHARDPYTRIDILPSSRRVRVEVDGITVADSTDGLFLFESGLPARYYLPQSDVRMHLLTPTDKVTACPYKGTARYWSVTIGDAVHPDLVWGYDHPLPESERIAGMVSFYNERADIFLDEVLQERPKTKFS
jgi:uncharacterized protein (DUF427 family)